MWILKISCIAPPEGHYIISSETQPCFSFRTFTAFNLIPYSDVCVPKSHLLWPKFISYHIILSHVVSYCIIPYHITLFMLNSLQFFLRSLFSEKIVWHYYYKYRIKIDLTFNSDDEVWGHSDLSWKQVLKS